MRNGQTGVLRITALLLISSLWLWPVAEAGAAILSMDSDYPSKGCTPSNPGYGKKGMSRSLYAGAAMAGMRPLLEPVTPFPALYGNRVGRNFPATEFLNLDNFD